MTICHVRVTNAEHPAGLVTVAVAMYVPVPWPGAHRKTQGLTPARVLSSSVEPSLLAIMRCAEVNGPVAVIVTVFGAGTMLGGDPARVVVNAPEHVLRARW